MAQFIKLYQLKNASGKSQKFPPLDFVNAASIDNKPVYRKVVIKKGVGWETVTPVCEHATSSY